MNDKKPKSQSQRMRNVIFRLWEQKNTELDFDTYYKKMTDLIINQIQSKLL